ncbi:MAG: hypothetical protein DWI58_12580 [Chloroflexi bacterium]|nr:MAG: hypothetical protein DWI58_12580 [Chloroflexota bacterium]
MPKPSMSAWSVGLWVVAMTLAACGGATPAAPGTAPADDRVLFVHLGDLARQRIQEATPGAALHQVDVLPGDGRYTFRFVDPASSRVVSASGSISAKAPADFSVTTEALGTLAVPPTTPIDLATLRVGPDGIVAAAVQALGAATPRTLVLSRQDGRLVWRAVVNGPQGIVSGTVADETGRFVPDAR